MKKYILLILITLFTITSFAQNNKINVKFAKKKFMKYAPKILPMIQKDIIPCSPS